MNKEFVTYEQASTLKQLEFDEPCFGCYDEKGVFGLTVISIEDYYTNTKEDTWNCSAPLYQQAFKWFREKHRMCSWIDRMYTENNIAYYRWTIEKPVTDPPNYNNTWITLKEYSTYEEAEETCLKKLCKIVKENL